MDSDLVYSEVQETAVFPTPPGPSAGRSRDDHGATPEAAASGHAALFPADEGDDFRRRWREIQGDFVDEPRRAVEQANALVEHVIQRLTDVFANERAKLENEWGQGKDVSTEDLRQALRQYRSFFDRLLSV
ncbi:MAG TPA: hypothetical protein VFW44_13520 [Bryobacteraceae bacterium]|nr:hypothetical protein [Bryobacteraceae bacterium]